MTDRVPAETGPTLKDPRGRWPTGPSRPQLRRGEIHVWRADAAEIAAALGSERLSVLIAPGERERAEHMSRRAHGELWMAARATLRVLLSRYLDREPCELALVIGAHGKPRLYGQHRLSFNLSHSAGTVVFAFCADGPVGVDVEFTRRGRNRVAVVRRALGEAEAERLLVLEPRLREREFLRAWTRHEAALKCRGIGLGAGAPATKRHRAPWIAELQLGPEAVGAVAAERAPQRLFGWRAPLAILALPTH
jgi:4'-phosphopantetheinyl transferase